ncbi:hypothetical protein [Amycolatopsis regifaucium]|uniref:Uncharacterized protein n=1 Tax=Amycolatopsis regifaucium TaxID=546365 RepID=A0A154MP08_9PSEU|nr:hypothetical protein [Amycolatopsis regifaucium]KZB85820.1 hypothetical protein AVL48_29560 [Amycolatopsis regifaucium]OKA10681.1 hypothetical protein ATP06_0204350 [Amycolatopsis regifaucium]SFI84830.1 hypothetical protein SAMN04489731_113241 [Amycolatopsis regifaucium]
MPDPQVYDPYRLIDDVEGLLIQRGHRPERVEGRAGDRVAGASRLLRGLGIEPLRAPGDALDLDGQRAYQARVHGD